MHEHPNKASSWQMPEVIEFAAHPDVNIAVCDMCAYGTKVQDADGEAYARERIRLMPNEPEVLSKLSKVCMNQIPNGRQKIAKPMPRAAKTMYRGVRSATGVCIDEPAGETLSLRVRRETQPDTVMPASQAAWQRSAKYINRHSAERPAKAELLRSGCTCWACGRSFS